MQPPLTLKGLFPNRIVICNDRIVFTGKEVNDKMDAIIKCEEFNYLFEYLGFMNSGFLLNMSTLYVEDFIDDLSTINLKSLVSSIHKDTLKDYALIMMRATQ
jgi:hypothetical protein